MTKKSEILFTEYIPRAIRLMDHIGKTKGTVSNIPKPLDYCSVEQPQEDIVEFFPNPDQHFMQVYAPQISMAAYFSSISDEYNLWEVHTNFTIDLTVQNAMEQTEGVEGLFVLSKYRAIISIGKLFDMIEVQKNMKQNLLID